MPFTLSHAIVALPLRRFGSIAGAVAVGSMAPDLPLFFRVLPYGATHRLDAFALTLAFALLLLLMWRLLVRPAVGELSPQWLAKRLPTAWRQPAAMTLQETLLGSRGLAAVVTFAGLVLGAASHIVWDAFTHADRFGQRIFPILGGHPVG